MRQLIRRTNRANGATGCWPAQILNSIHDSFAEIVVAPLPSNRPERRQQFLKAASRTARARIVSSELLQKLLVPMHDAEAAFDLGFRWETFATFVGDFEITNYPGRTLDLRDLPYDLHG